MSEKTHTEEFETCVSQVMEQGHEKSSAFAICTDSFQKAGKPIFVGESEKQKLHLFCESFKLEGNKVSGVAIHPKRIFHPEEDIEHVYLREELMKAAPTGAGKPFGIDHIYVLPPPNLLTKSWYCPDEDGICFEGLVDDYIAEQIRQKKFKGISIELNWLRPGGSVQYVNGVAARNFELTSVHFLKQFPPGDPDAYVKLWEQIKVPPSPLGLKNPAKAKRGLKMKEAEFKAKLKKYPEYIQKRYLKLLEAKIPLNRLDKLLEAEWDTEYINDLPDSAFAVIAPGGEKDEQGKTVPRDLRKLPHHNMQDNLDLDHLRAALARLNQIEPADLQPKAKKHLCGHARGEKAEDLVSEFCGEEQSTAQECLKAQIRGLLKKLKEQEPEVDECVRAGLEVGMLVNQIADMCGVSVQYVKDFTEAKKLKEQLITPEKRDCVEQGIAAGLSKDEIAQECEVSLADLELFEALREQQGNQEPEKDEHGCLIGKERYDEEQDKCVPITAEARAAFLEAKLTLIEQEGELTVEEIEAKIAELTKEKEELDKKLWPEAPETGLSDEEKTAIRTQIEILWAKIDAYEQALKAKISAQAVPPTTPSGETEIKEIKETIVALRRKLIQAEAKIYKIEKKRKQEATSWKEKFEKLREAVKGAIPVDRVWRSWSIGPQMYVQENLKILRETESESQS